MKLRLLILLSIVMAGSSVAWAQDYDDIYYDNSKTKTSTKVQNNTRSNNNRYSTAVTNSSSNWENGRDVDEYNRRGGSYSQSNVADSLEAEGNQDNFVYTDRIKRFHNPTIIIESNDPDVADLYYYSAPSVNLIIGTSGYYGYGWNSPYWSGAWAWPGYSWYGCGSGWYRPWGWGGYYSYYDPFWGSPYWGGYYSSWYSPYWGGYHSHWGYPYYGYGYGHGHGHYYSNDGGRRPFAGGSHYAGSGRPSSNGGYSTAGRRPQAITGVNSRPGNVGVTSGNGSFNGSNGHRSGTVGSGRVINGTQSQATGTTTNNYGRRPLNNRVNNSSVSSRANNNAIQSSDSYSRQYNSNNNSSSYERRQSNYNNNNSYQSSSRSSSYSNGGFSSGRSSGGNMGGSRGGFSGGGHRR